jgi:hypothetical protein
MKVNNILLKFIFPVDPNAPAENSESKSETPTSTPPPVKASASPTGFALFVKIV